MSLDFVTNIIDICSFKMANQVSHRHKTSGNITGLCIIVFAFTFSETSMNWKTIHVFSSYFHYGISFLYSSCIFKT